MESVKDAPSGHAPSAATNAVLKPSDPVPQGVRMVKGIEFDDYEGRDITVNELVAGMADMGFQASAVGDAVRIINDMVSFAACYISCESDRALESVERSRNGTEDHHFSWIHLESDLVRPT